MFMQMLDDSLSRVLDEASFVGARFRLHGLQSFFFFNKFILFIYLFYLFIFGCVGSSLLRAGFSSCSEWGPLFIAVRGLLIVVASLVAEHGL